MGSIGIFYGSNGGVTGDVAGQISSALEKKDFSCDLINVANASAGDFEKYDKVILGTSTWGMGDLQDDWETFIDQLDGVNFGGKTVAFFGTGDQEAYPDTFVDGIGMIYEKVPGDAKKVGEWPTDEYDFSDSKGVVDGKFVGLVIDEDNQSSMTKERISAWVEQIANHF